MRHRKSRHQFNRRGAWRTATIQGLTCAVLRHDSIFTTLTRAKAAQPVVEKLISWGKSGTLKNRRLAFEILADHSLVTLLFSDIAPRFKSRTGGFTRILRVKNRRGDDAQLVLFQLTELSEKGKETRHKKADKKTREDAAQRRRIQKKQNPPNLLKSLLQLLFSPRKQSSPRRNSLEEYAVFSKKREILYNLYAY